MCAGVRHTGPVVASRERDLALGRGYPGQPVGHAGGWIIAVEIGANELAKFVRLVLPNSRLLDRLVSN